jgi:hypothetical protein
MVTSLCSPSKRAACVQAECQLLVYADLLSCAAGVLPVGFTTPLFCVVPCWCVFLSVTRALVCCCLRVAAAARRLVQQVPTSRECCRRCLASSWGQVSTAAGYSVPSTSV